MRKMVAAGALALIGAAGAAAQTPLPDETVPPEQQEEFRLCRVAVFMHLDDPSSENSLVPPEVAQTMLEQFNLIMFETLRQAPAGSVAEARRAVEFAENFFLSFSRTIAENRGRLEDRETREALLMRCQPLLWRVLEEQIDALLRWREQAAGAPPAPEEEDAGDLAP